MSVPFTNSAAVTMMPQLSSLLRVCVITSACISDIKETFNAARTDPDNVIVSSIIGRRHVVDHRVDDSLLATDIESTLD